jgi:formate hydrogenlyase transcriptional activator
VACQRSNWKLGGPRGAAAKLGLKRTTLFYKMKRLGISAPADHLQE